jgi:sulfoxide reductase catalytic subunit YedY
MISANKPDVLPSEITPRSVYENRRQFLKAAGFSLATSAVAGLVPAFALAANNPQKIVDITKTDYGRGEKLTSYKDVTTYNNYYEFGSAKGDPVVHAKLFKTHPWSVEITGEVKQEKRISIEDILKLAPLEERVYRMRCVEGWSMVIPWVGFPLSKLIQHAEPTGNAKFVEFTTLADPQQMAGVRIPILDWPYTEGLRMDEAMHPLTILAVGLYGETLSNQNGAPIRLVVPWKYGFKGAKSIVRIHFTENMPITTWMKASPREYGFYANVNPKVPHPRWSQASERRIGGGLLSPRIKTQLFNGYADKVAHLYTGMDLHKNF